MKKLLFLSLITILPGIETHAQTFAWARGISTIGSAIYTSRPAIDDSGNVYLAGQFSGTADLDPGPGVANYTSLIAGSMFILKLNANGDFVWVKTFSPTGAGASAGTALGVDRSGNVVIGGYFSGTVDFDPGAGTLSTTAIGSTDAYLLKLSANGSLIWLRQLGGTSTEGVLWLTIDDQDNILATGHFNGTADFDGTALVSNLTSAGGADIFVIKLNNAGDLRWAKRMGGLTDDWGYGICTDKNGNVYTTGQFFNTVDFDPGPGTFNLVTSPYYRDIFVSKLDSAGNFRWAGQMGDPTTDDIGYGIAVDAAGNMYTTGSFGGVSDFDPGTGTSYLTASGGTFDGYISKFDSTGAFVWVKQIGGSAGSDGGRSITLDTFGNIYSIGSFNGTVDLDPGTGINNLVAASTQYDAYISKLDAGGNFVWAGQVGGTGSDPGYAISLDKQGTIYTSGVFQGTADLDPCTTVDTLNGSILGMYVNKIYQCLPYTPSITIVVSDSGSTSGYPDTLSAIVAAGTGPVTYQWYVNGTAIAGATSSVYILNYADVDTVTCSITVSDTCANASSAVSNGIVLSILSEGVATVTGNLQGLALYPNPNNGSFNIAGSTNAGAAAYSVIDVTGTTILTGSIMPVNGKLNCHIHLPANTPSGNYFMRIVGGDAVEVVKLVVN